MGYTDGEATPGLQQSQISKAINTQIYSRKKPFSPHYMVAWKLLVMRTSQDSSAAAFQGTE